MPTSIVDIEITTDTAAIPGPTFGTVALIGTAASPPPDANFGDAELYSAASNVETDFGSTSDVAIASNAVAEMGVSQWYVIVLEETAVTGETLDDDSMGTLDTFPILGDPAPAVSVGDLTFVTGTPDNGITSGVELNTATGQYYNAESGNTIDYSYVDWTTLENQFSGLGVNLPYVADKQYDRRHVGTLDEIVSLADSFSAATVAASVNGATEPDEETAITKAHDVFGFTPSGSLLPVAHKSSEDVGAYIIGQAATNPPYYDVFYDGEGYPFNTEFYRDVNVGSPGTPDTFEGGDAENKGPTNVLINKAGTTVLSNSLSAAGAASSYQFWDIKRTENFAKTLIQNALTSLRLSEERIPFTVEGRTLIRGAISEAFNGQVGGVRDPFSEIDITVPPVDSIPENDRANRVYSGIVIDGTLSGNVHEFQLQLNIGV